jgi:CheY-like chemotaxis protein
MTRKSPVILVADDDEGHRYLVQQNLVRGGMTAPLIPFEDGQAILDFLLRRGDGPHREPDRPYLLLLDIRMPKIDGVEVLRQVKADPDLRKLPVIILTTTDDPREVLRCHEFGCSVYIQKPVSYDKLADAIRQLGTFINMLTVPPVPATRAPDAPR